MDSPEAESNDRTEERVFRHADHQLHATSDHALHQDSFHTLPLDLIECSPQRFFIPEVEPHASYIALMKDAL